MSQARPSVITKNSLLQLSQNFVGDVFSTFRNHYSERGVFRPVEDVSLWNEFGRQTFSFEKVLPHLRRYEVWRLFVVNPHS